MLKSFQIVLAFCGPRNPSRIVLTETAPDLQTAQKQALKRGRALTGRRMRLSERAR
jgi:hypothetical protein